jgi:LytS/YehU family sensor histidine kinase
VYSIIVTVVICIPFIVLSRYFVYTGKYSIGLWLYLPIVIVTYIIANCGSLLRGFINWIENSKQKAEMEKRNLQLELEALRSQVNPHFLFNTLNNIDSLILSQPQKASAMIITLSEVMRYMLYQTKNAKVTLEMENKHLENVLALHRIRFAQSNYIQFDCSISQPERTIAPLLFLPFVENACKFAQFKQTLPVIVITLHQTENTVTFTCNNTFDAKAVTSTENGGIGLENVKKRLQLLYPKNHSLKIENDGTCFFVTLVVNLS